MAVAGFVPAGRLDDGGGREREKGGREGERKRDRGRVGLQWKDVAEERMESLPKSGG